LDIAANCCFLGVTLRIGIAEVLGYYCKPVRRVFIQSADKNQKKLSTRAEKRKGIL
jgi:hypothetical protein